MVCIKYLLSLLNKQLKTDKMAQIEKMNKLDFVDYLISGKGVSAFYFYHETKLLSMKFDLDEMKLKFNKWLENKK